MYINAFYSRDEPGSHGPRPSLHYHCRVYLTGRLVCEDNKQTQQQQQKPCETLPESVKHASACITHHIGGLCL